MGKVAIVTDSNSGITQKQAAEMGIYVLPIQLQILACNIESVVGLVQNLQSRHCLRFLRCYPIPRN